MKGVKEDLTGRRFGKLVVLECLGLKQQKNGEKKTVWRCKCDCGKETLVITASLNNGNTKSCGCLRNKKYALTHGKRNTRIYKLWCGMKQRCYYKKHQHYKDYGGRGITICKEWLDDFMNFYNWAIANGYADNLSIDRIDVNGNYTPNNCRWVTQKTQSNNTRRNKKISYNGKQYTISELAAFLGVKAQTLNYRIKHGYKDNELKKGKKNPSKSSSPAKKKRD